MREDREVREIQGIDQIMIPRLSWEVKAPTGFPRGPYPVSLIFGPGAKVREVHAGRGGGLAEWWLPEFPPQTPDCGRKRCAPCEPEHHHQPGCGHGPGRSARKRVTLSVNTQEVLRKSMVRFSLSKRDR